MTKKSRKSSAPNDSKDRTVRSATQKNDGRSSFRFSLPCFLLIGFLRRQPSFPLGIPRPFRTDKRPARFTLSSPPDSLPRVREIREGKTFSAAPSLMPLPLPLKCKRFKNTCPLFFLSPALPRRGVKNLKALVDPLHLPRVLDLRTRRFADDIRLQFQLFQRYGERIKFGA